MKRVAILISGGGSNMEALLEDMKGDHPCRPALVLSNRADAGGLAKAEGQGVLLYLSQEGRGIGP